MSLEFKTPLDIAAFILPPTSQNHLHAFGRQPGAGSLLCQPRQVHISTSQCQYARPPSGCSSDSDLKRIILYTSWLRMKELQKNRKEERVKV